MSKKTHTPFGMDEGVHKMCEELFEKGRYVKPDQKEVFKSTCNPIPTFIAAEHNIKKAIQ